MEALIQHVTARVDLAKFSDQDDYILVRVPNPQDFSEEELSQIAGKPVKLEVLPNALG